MLKEVPAHLENGMQLIETVQEKDQSFNKHLPYLFSLDVASLYTFISVNEAIGDITNKINTNLNGLTRNDIQNFPSTILRNMYFQFNSTIYQQIEGLPIGSSLSGILAVLFMDRLERKTLTRHQPHIEPYKHYVDHIYMQTTDESQFLGGLGVNRKH